MNREGHRLVQVMIILTAIVALLSIFGCGDRSFYPGTVELNTLQWEDGEAGPGTFRARAVRGRRFPHKKSWFYIPPDGSEPVDPNSVGLYPTYRACGRWECTGLRIIYIDPDGDFFEVIRGKLIYL